MPVYEYECEDCGNRIEVVCKIAERPETIECKNILEEYGPSGMVSSLQMCPGQMRQIITAPAIQVDTAQDIPWLDEFARTRKEARFGGPKIQTRREYKEYLVKHDLRPASGENLSEV